MHEGRLITYVQVISGAAYSTLGIKIMTRQKRESDKKNSHCRLCGPKLSLDYQIFPTPLPRRPSYCTVHCTASMYSFYIFVMIFIVVFHPHSSSRFFHSHSKCFFHFTSSADYEQIGKPYPVGVESSSRFENCSPSATCTAAWSAQL